MKGRRFTEEQIIGVPNEAEQTGNIREICRSTISRSRGSIGGERSSAGWFVSEAKRLNELERENAELKTMVAEQALDIRMLQDLNSKKW
jgi:putative transposase